MSFHFLSCLANNFSHLIKVSAMFLHGLQEKFMLLKGQSLWLGRLEGGGTIVAKSQDRIEL